MSQDNIKFAYWVPNVSGRLVISKIEQRTSWDIDYNRKLAQIAKRPDSSTPCHRSVLQPVMAPKISMSR